MKKFIVIISVLLSINCAIAANQYSAVLDKLENSLYGFTYTTSDDASRLSRIEESVYGQSRPNKSINESPIAAHKKPFNVCNIKSQLAIWP